MSRKRNRDEEEVVVVKEPMSDVKSALPQAKMPVMSFDAWWVQAQRRNGFASYLKEAVYKHFKARGFLKSGKYEEGLQDFGY